MTQDAQCTRRTDWIPLAREVLDIEIEGIAAMRDRLNGGFVDALTLMARCTGRVVITGLGKSGLVGRKLAATLSSTGTPAFFLHPVEGAHGDMGMLRSDDVIIAISNSGETDELNAILPALRSLGASLIAMTGGLESTLAKSADVVLDTGVRREACPLNLAPTASTTAVLAMGDALAVCLIHWKSFTENDFLRFHPGGSLGHRLSMRVESLMHTENLPVVRETVRTGEALRVLDEGRLGTVLVTDGQGRLSGILTDGDVRRMVCREAGVETASPVANVMVRSPLTARKEFSVAQLIDMMEERAITVLPITGDDGLLLGVVHLHDLLGKGGVKFSR
ncbi:KpsF/GutQ family protein [Oleidesulfovibrio alaskensis G20]|jgi:arabinose-5-phosphate isomerase|uniref:KpsF/GutQ family protein n=1 Tax=Oleidesulfovibrio alaskensis (strain ATCC BAA-1058 / DSM 17464 / G20) TaxID=207559 RepID=Q316L0_OLEA2|nr:KpsF/GutQ family sugar-phosphate isomerase [Oleidesulfovibrio alaskensis]ABB37136.1 KpsF/GutQ family protein [Oleidesulfovibrio alaskensis G20]MBG0774148.1 KpsF/GutQ family sugar-phosphate isomerase [Oleidesulfovibrio alaskensis]